jgi:hypothetical protein
LEFRYLRQPPHAVHGFFADDFSRRHVGSQADDISIMMNRIETTEIEDPPAELAAGFSRSEHGVVTRRNRAAMPVFVSAIR